MLAFKEERKKPTFDQRDLAPFEIQEIGVLDKNTLKILTNDKDNDEIALDIISTLYALVDIKNRGDKILLPFEKIEHEKGLNTFAIKGDAKGFIIELAKASYISKALRAEILENTEFQEMMEAQSPDVSDVDVKEALETIHRMYQRYLCALPPEAKIEFRNGVTEMVQRTPLESSPKSHKILGN